MPKLLDRIFTRPCTHEFSWPRRRRDGSHYQVCLACGEQYAYDWVSMSRGDRITVPADEQHDVGVGPTSTWIPRTRRLHSNTPALYRQSGEVEWHSGTLVNISESGVLIEGDQSLPKDADLEMIFEMPEEISGQPNSRVFCHGYLAWTRCKPSGDISLGVSVSRCSFLHED